MLSRQTTTDDRILRTSPHPLGGGSEPRCFYCVLLEGQHPEDWGTTLDSWSDSQDEYPSDYSAGMASGPLGSPAAYANEEDLLVLGTDWEYREVGPREVHVCSVGRAANQWEGCGCEECNTLDEDEAEVDSV